MTGPRTRSRCATGRNPLLADAGASSNRLDDVDWLVCAALSGNRTAVADTTPSLRARAVDRRPDAMPVAAEHHGVPALERLIDVGFDINSAGPDGRTALHQAALEGAVAICQWLLTHDADRTIRDHNYDATPAQWASHAQHDDLATRLRPGT